MLLVASETSPSPRAVRRHAGAMREYRTAKNTFSRGARPQHFLADNWERIVGKRTNTLHHVTDTRLASGRQLPVPRAPSRTAQDGFFSCPFLLAWRFAHSIAKR